VEDLLLESMDPLYIYSMIWVGDLRLQRYLPQFIFGGIFTSISTPRPKGKAAQARTLDPQKYVFYEGFRPKKKSMNFCICIFRPGFNHINPYSWDGCVLALTKRGCRFKQTSWRVFFHYLSHFSLIFIIF
jgi:hypothetical protein